jgi:serine/threonine-protein kinase
MPHAPRDTAAAGQIIGGKYRVLRLLGSGGMGDVVAAEHLQLRHVVAIKRLSSRAQFRPEVIARFMREARATVRLQSEHVARVLDLGTLEDGLPYIVMEHLEGTDFEQFVQNCGRMPPREVAACVLQACEAIAEAHGMGIVHRDLKPSNLFLKKGPDGNWFVKVLDFGISKIAEDAEGESLTSTSDVLGTPAYMAPEQIKSAKLVDERTDIWALGLILAECISGRPVYRGSSKIGVIAKISGEPVPDLGLDPLHVPLGLERVIHKCLQKDPAQRFQNIAELATALAPFAGDASTTNIDRIENALRRPRRRRRFGSGHGLTYASIAGASTVVAGLGFYAAYSVRQSAEPQQTLVESSPPVQPSAARSGPEPESSAPPPVSHSAAPARPSTPKAGTRPREPRNVRAPAPLDGLEDRK